MVLAFMPIVIAIDESMVVGHERDEAINIPRVDVLVEHQRG
jgi:hypothetical protein